MKNVNYTFEFSDLASRSGAAQVRAQIEDAASRGEVTRLDFERVLSVSESYADELFGVLVKRHGLEWLLDNVTIENTREQVLIAIVRAIRTRIEEGSSDTLARVLAAVQARSKSTPAPVRG